MLFPQKRHTGATGSLVSAGLGIAVILLAAGARGAEEVPEVLRQRALEELRVLDRAAPRPKADPRRGRFSPARPLARPAVRRDSSGPRDAAAEFAAPARKSAAEVTESLPEYRPEARQASEEPGRTELDPAPPAGDAKSNPPVEAAIAEDDPFATGGESVSEPVDTAEDPFGTTDELFGREEEFEAPGAAIEFGPPEPFEEESESGRTALGDGDAGAAPTPGKGVPAVEDFTPVIRPDSTPVSERPADAAPASQSGSQASPFDELSPEIPFDDDSAESQFPAGAEGPTAPASTSREEVLGAGRPISVLEVLAGAVPAAAGEGGAEVIGERTDEAAAKPAEVATTPEAQERKIAERADRDGLLGFCPVTLREARALLDGRPEFASEFEGESYLLASLDAKALFDSHPERYAPAAKGRDIVLAAGRLEVRGSLRHATWYRGRLYLFRSEQTCRLFAAAPERYVSEEEPAGQ